MSNKNYPDLKCQVSGGIALLVPLTMAAYDWLVESCDYDLWQWTAYPVAHGGRALTVEASYADSVMQEWGAAQ